jgi:hypothetical protein
VTTFAHSGHWLASLAYTVPVIGLLGFLAWAKLREKRQGRLNPRSGEDPT